MPDKSSMETCDEMMRHCRYYRRHYKYTMSGIMITAIFSSILAWSFTGSRSLAPISTLPAAPPIVPSAPPPPCIPPPSPPPPSPPPLLPGSVTWQRVAWHATIAGTVEAFTDPARALFQDAVAALANVSSSDVELSVAPASVDVTSIIRSDPSLSAQLLSSLASVSASTLSNLVPNVSVTNVSSPELLDVVITAAPSPPPPSPPFPPQLPCYMSPPPRFDSDDFDEVWAYMINFMALGFFWIYYTMRSIGEAAGSFVRRFKETLKRHRSTKENQPILDPWLNACFEVFLKRTEKARPSMSLALNVVARFVSRRNRSPDEKSEKSDPPTPTVLVYDEKDVLAKLQPSPSKQKVNPTMSNSPHRGKNAITDMKINMARRNTIVACRASRELVPLSLLSVSLVSIWHLNSPQLSDDAALLILLLLCFTYLSVYFHACASYIKAEKDQLHVKGVESEDVALCFYLYNFFLQPRVVHMRYCLIFVVALLLVLACILSDPNSHPPGMSQWARFWRAFNNSSSSFILAIESVFSLMRSPSIGMPKRFHRWQYRRFQAAVVTRAVKEREELEDAEIHHRRRQKALAKAKDHLTAANKRRDEARASAMAAGTVEARNEAEDAKKAADDAKKDVEAKEKEVKKSSERRVEHLDLVTSSKAFKVDDKGRLSLYGYGLFGQLRHLLLSSSLHEDAASLVFQESTKIAWADHAKEHLDRNTMEKVVDSQHFDSSFYVQPTSPQKSERTSDLGPSTSDASTVLDNLKRLSSTDKTEIEEEEKQLRAFGDSNYDASYDASYTALAVKAKANSFAHRWHTRYAVQKANQEMVQIHEGALIQVNDDFERKIDSIARSHKQELDQHISARSRLQEALLKSRSETAHMMKILQGELDSQDATVKELQQTIHEQKVKNDGLEEKVRQAEILNEDLAVEADDSKTKSSELSEKLATQSDEIKGLLSELREQEKELHSRENNTNKELRETMEKLHEQERALASANTQLGLKEAKITRQATEFDAQRKLAEDARNEAGAAQKRAEEARNDLTRVTQELNALKEALREREVQADAHDAVGVFASTHLSA